MKFGAGSGFKGVAFLINSGYRSGNGNVYRGKLMPNLELGHIILHGDDAEKYASDAARKNEDLSWEDWGKRFSEYLAGLNISHGLI